jgi:hypothetical protein
VSEREREISITKMAFFLLAVAGAVTVYIYMRKRVENEGRKKGYDRNKNMIMS